MNASRCFPALAIAGLLLSALPLRAEIPANVVAERVGIDQKLNAQIPLALTFRDETGKVVHLGDYFGSRPVVLNLVYYQCPMLCTQVLNGLVSAMRAVNLTVGEDFDIVTVSINHKETPALAMKKKQQYVADYDRPAAARGWHFLTGDSLAVKALTDAVGFRFMYDPKTDQYAHASAIMIATPEGRLSRYLFGIEYAPRDLKFGLMDAADSKIGSLSDKVLMLCYNYDPHTGKYGLAIMTLIRTGGILTVLGIIGYVIYAGARNRRRRIVEPSV